MSIDRYRELEPCNLGDLGEILHDKYDLECKHFSTAVYDEDAVDPSDWGDLGLIK